MKAKRIIDTVGTLAVVGAASIAGAALWTNVLAGKIKMAKIKKMHLQSSNVIVVDFKKARKEMGR